MESGYHDIINPSSRYLMLYLCLIFSVACRFFLCHGMRVDLHGTWCRMFTSHSSLPFPPVQPRFFVKTGLV